MKRLVAAMVAGSLLLAGCDSGDDRGKEAEPTGTTAPPGDAPLPGQRVEIYPYRGARLAVVGVADGDRLNVRSGPGVEFPVVVTLGPLAVNATATGHNRSVGEGEFWSQIEADGRTGWARSTFLLQPGEVSDVTANLYPHPAARPRAETMRRLGQIVAERRGGGEPPARVVVVDEPPVGDLAEITVDVIGLGDDAQGGERLKIFANPGPAGARFTLRSVEATALCSRGVTGDRLCV